MSTSKSTGYLRTGLVILIVALAFFGSYKLATGKSGVAAGTAAVAVAPGTNAPRVNGRPSTSGSGSTGSGPSFAPAGGCCGGGATAGETVEGAATVAGDVQRITVETSSGYYQPNYITLAAGVPAEITFKQASGCLSEVVSTDLGFNENLTTGDKTVRLSADQVKPGTYSFTCGMRMVYGTIIVK